MYTTFERYSSGLGSRLTRGFLRNLVKVIVATLLLYLLISSTFLAAYQVDSVSMIPLLEPGDRILVSPLTYGARFLFFSSRLPAIREPARGDVVVIHSPHYRKPSFPLSVLEPIVRFLTLQRASIVRDEGGNRVPPYMVKRILGLPGDTVKMANFKVYVMTPGSSAFVEEQRLVPSSYTLLIEGLPEGWSRDFPFSGEMEALTLAEGQYFFLGDNRQSSSDSRSWGPLPRESILGKAVYRYWPPDRGGRL